ncbi:hypothetical protein D3C87_1871700 [compost metagenome]
MVITCISADDFLRTLTPVCLTSEGSPASASDTRFCTLTVAMSGSVPTANVTVSV